MEELWETLSNLEQNQVIKKSCPIRWKATDLMNQALKNAECDSISEMAIQLDKILQEPNAMLYALPPKESGFKEITNGVIGEMNVNAEHHGLVCMNPGHQGSAASLAMETLFCDLCQRTGPPQTEGSKQWSLAGPLIPIISTRPMFLVVLVSRSSSGQKIQQSVYDDLRRTVVSQQTEILDFLRMKTGRNYDIHIIAQVAINGSVLALPNDADTHVRKNSEEQRIPASHIPDLFFFNRTSTTMVGYMTNSPGEFTGKISTHYNNLHYLEKGGIKPSSVVFMANGVHVVQGFGVVRNFTKFTGEDLIDATQHHVENDFVDFPFTREPTVEGYVTGMTKEAGTRLVRPTLDRKK